MDDIKKGFLLTVGGLSAWILVQIGLIIFNKFYIAFDNIGGLI